MGKLRMRELAQGITSMLSNGLTNANKCKQMLTSIWHYLWPDVNLNLLDIATPLVRYGMRVLVKGVTSMLTNGLTNG